jgi:hypothetical protein
MCACKHQLRAAEVPARLKPALQRDEPETLRALVDMTPLLLEKCGRAYVSEHVVPMLCKALAKEGHAPLQVRALHCTVIVLNVTKQRYT